MGVLTRCTPVFLLAMLAKIAKHYRVFTLRLSCYTLKISKFCERVRGVQVRLAACKLDSVQHSVVLTTDTGLLAIVLASYV